MRKLTIILMYFLLIHCNNKDDINKIFVNKDVKELFIIFCDEVINSDIKHSDNVYIYTDDGHNISFINTYTLNDSHQYGKFVYRGLHIYVDPSVSKDIITLDKYDYILPRDENEYNYPIDFIEMWLHLVDNKIKYRKINFKGSFGEWEEYSGNAR